MKRTSNQNECSFCLQLNHRPHFWAAWYGRVVWRRNVGEERLAVRQPLPRLLACLRLHFLHLRANSATSPHLHVPPIPSTSLPRKHRRLSSWFNMQTILTPLRGQSVAPAPESEPQRLFQCSTCKRSFTRADHLTRHVRAREYLISHAIRQSERCQ
jgi:uncharacterized Zn-finger protein